MDRLGVPITGQPRREVFGNIEQPGIAGFGGEQHKLSEADDTLILLCCPMLNVADLIGKPKLLSSTIRLPGPRLIFFATVPRRVV